MPSMHNYPMLVLDRAATALHAIGRTSPDDTTPTLRVHCLFAADQLATVGAQISPRDIAADAIESTLRRTLSELGQLPPEVFAQPGVLHAARATRDALRAHTR